MEFTLDKWNDAINVFSFHLQQMKCKEGRQTGSKTYSRCLQSESTNSSWFRESSRTWAKFGGWCRSRPAQGGDPEELHRRQQLPELRCPSSLLFPSAWCDFALNSDKSLLHVLVKNCLQVNCEQSTSIQERWWRNIRKFNSHKSVRN
jgi:hypothetical protein